MQLLLAIVGDCKRKEDVLLRKPYDRAVGKIKKISVLGNPAWVRSKLRTENFRPRHYIVNTTLNRAFPLIMC
jgi:hypothetical protein